MASLDPSLFGLEGKVGIVLGGGRGMGESTAMLLARAGCHVAIIDNDKGRASDVAEKVKAAGRKSTAIVADLLDAPSCEAAIKQAEQTLDGLDVMVSIVGQANFAPLLTLTEDQWDQDHVRNLRFFFIAARAAAAAMIRRKVPGAIACVASIDGIISAPHHGAYGAAKAGLMQLVQTMAVEWAQYGIRVNAVAPGTINTPRLPETPQSRALVEQSVIPMARAGTTEEIGKPLLFLVSDMASYVTGQTLLVDGGWSASNIFDPRKLTVKTSL